MMRNKLHYLAAAAMLLGLAAPALAASEPVVGSLSPTSATAGSSTTLSASYSDPDGVAGCTLLIDGVLQGSMSLSGGANSTSGTASLNHTFSANGSYKAQARCTDVNGNVGLSALTTITAGPSSPPGPSVGAITPVTATVGVATSFSATYSDTDAVSTCSLYVNGTFQNIMTLSASGATSGTASLSHTFSSGGSYELQARCTDASGNVGHGASTTVVVSPLSPPAPVVGVITPTAVTAGVSASLSASYSDTDAITGCTLYIDGAASGAMSLSGSTSGTATINHNFIESGNYQVQARCTDAAANVGMGSTVTLTAFASAAAPSVGSISPTSATLNASATLSASYSDTDTVSSCTLWIDGTNQGAMTLSGSTSGTASKSFTFTTTGNHTAQAKCTDAAGNVGTGSSTTVTVTTTGLTVSAPAQTSATLNAATNITATYSSSATVNSCTLIIDGSEQGAMTLSGSTSGTASKSFTFTATGNHTAQVKCTDASGSMVIGGSSTINVSGSTGADTTPPFTPTNLVHVTATTDNTATFTWSAASDNVGVTSYEISIDGSAYFTVGNTTQVTTGVLANGNHTISVRARDAAGNVSGAASLSFTINADTSSGPPFPGPAWSLEILDGEATFVIGGHTRGEFEARNGRGCEMAADAAIAARTRTLGNITNATARANAENFIACGTASTRVLGAGERLGVINSFRAAFGRLPETKEDWFDIIKIANGRFPGSANATAESKAKVAFKLVYLRDANMSVTADNNAVIVMAYGLRPLPRNLSSEAAAIITFRAVYGRLPTTATDWDIVRAVAYSGATR